jgi:hypothetical protein
MGLEVKAFILTATLAWFALALALAEIPAVASQAADPQSPIGLWKTVMAAAKLNPPH